jgi:hypothetical protein
MESWSKRLTDDGDIVLGGLELPESDINGDTTLTLGLQFVQNPGILEGALAQLSGFLSWLLAWGSSELSRDGQQ